MRSVESSNELSICTGQCVCTVYEILCVYIYMMIHDMQRYVCVNIYIYIYIYIRTHIISILYWCVSLYASIPLTLWLEAGRKNRY